MKDSDIEIIERDNNIPPEKSILATYPDLTQERRKALIDALLAPKGKDHGIWDWFPILPKQKEE